MSEITKKAVEIAQGTRYGLVEPLVPISSVKELSRLQKFSSIGARHIPGWWFRSFPKGTGVSLEADAARYAAVGEALERYCAMAPPDPVLLRNASFSQLAEPAVPPMALSLYSDRQYERFPWLHRLTESKPIEWTSAFSLTKSRPVLVPAALVFLSRARRYPNNFLAEVVSTGFASHVSVRNAILAGMCEVLERDAVAVAWLNRLPYTRLTLQGTPLAEWIRELQERLALKVRTFLVPSESPYPTIIAIGLRDFKYPHAMMGAACRADPIVAATKAVCELCQIDTYLSSRSPPKPLAIREFEDHAAFYATKEGARLLSKNLREGKTVQLQRLARPDVRSLDEELKFGVENLAAKGLEVIVSEITTTDVAACGFRVLRVLIPGSLDISADARFTRLGGSRLYNLPLKLGALERELDERELQRLPFPLA